MDLLSFVHQVNITYLLLSVIHEITFLLPPLNTGHHAEDDGAMGFCFFNNVAVAVASTLRKHADTIKKVLIIDW